jgi:hypothetical protein
MIYPILMKRVVVTGFKSGVEEIPWLNSRRLVCSSTVWSLIKLNAAVISWPWVGTA